MFTGIIRLQGKIQNVSLQGEARELTISVKTPLTLRPGDSVAVNGACLTVLEATRKSFRVRLMQETLAKTILGSLTVGSEVNLELPLSAGDTFDGHFVTGHVDGVTTIQDITAAGSDKIFSFELPKYLAAYVVPKGAVALDGVSLTVVDVTSDSFTVSFMPYTLRHTTFGKKQRGESVNLEVDMLGKYIVRFLETHRAAVRGALA